MDTTDFDIVASLLNQGAGTGLRLDSARRICAAYNPALLDSWLAQAPDPAAAPSFHLTDTLQRLFAPQAVASLLRQLDDVAANSVCAVHDLGSLPARSAHYGATSRQLGVSAQRIPSADAGLLLLLRDVTAAHELQFAATRAQAAADTSMALLRAEPGAIRVQLASVTASISALRATQRMPARTLDAMRDKLSRLHAGAALLQHESRTIGLGGVAQACGRLMETLHQLQRSAGISGNDLLPLAPLVDQIASAAGNAWRCEEQRYCAPAPQSMPEPRRSRKRTTWSQASERRWNQFLRRRGEEAGTLAKLSISGAEAVPTALYREVDEILQHLLRNAIEHGIETPEQRVAADKPATGQISIHFEDQGQAGLAMHVRDDGRGFDLHRIGQAAVMCGLLTEDSLLEHDAGDLVGLIFKPAFTTHGLDGSDGHGRGMTFLRNAVTRLNGQISVATKAGRYTQFNLQLPVGVSLQPAQAATYA